ncbi:prolyl oligopeptidase family serine peptidase [Deinococcus apachensis]|uniref:prolyl oligopeptidase family serine peptidase n=1 Tax=Deinococcus apachensis TaxID=309886 RepID=UPI00035DEBD9|nr:prolyl oligopeptidase family serine peptidase [Deinococcus apachensis]
MPVHLPRRVRTLLSGLTLLTPPGAFASPPAAPTSCREVAYLSNAPARVDARADLCVPDVHHDVAVLLVRGGGGTQGRRADLTAWQARLNREGYVTLNVDYALAAPTDPGPVFPRPERDVKAAVQYLRVNARTLGVDPARIVLFGTSAGARLGGVLLTTADDPAFAGEGRYVGVSDHLDGFIGLYGGYTGALAAQDAARYYGGQPGSADPGVRRAYELGDATLNAARATGPSLLVHGQADTTAPPRQSQRFQVALDAAGKDVQLLLVPGAGHGFDRERTRARPLSASGEVVARMVLAWLAQHFPTPTAWQRRTNPRPRLRVHRGHQHPHGGIQGRAGQQDQPRHRHRDLLEAGKPQQVTQAVVLLMEPWAVHDWERTFKGELKMSLLELKYDGGGRRYHLNGRRVYCGTILELYIGCGWVPVTFGMDGYQRPVAHVFSGNEALTLPLPDEVALWWLDKEAPLDPQDPEMQRRFSELVALAARPSHQAMEEREALTCTAWAWIVQQEEACSRRG